tara:strand:+ start:3163 stop:3741 length:579 start_codon:yes stop_codon:yes gene_type:complete
MKKSIYIELNGVIRDIKSKTVEVYKNDNLEKEFKEEYNGEDLQDYLGVESQDELIEFMYVEAPMRIFGYSGESDEGVSFMVNEFYKKYRDEYNIFIFSNEIEKSKPATLMFLARMGIVIDNISFFPLKDFETVNEKANIIITNNKNIIKNNNKNRYIKINQEDPNKGVKNILYVSSFKDLVEYEHIERNEFA